MKALLQKLKPKTRDGFPTELDEACFDPVQDPNNPGINSFFHFFFEDYLKNVLN